VKGAGSELEKEVRRILRELGSATIPQIMGKLQSKTSYQAVKKALERMISRGEVVRPALDSREARYYFAYIPITEWLEVSSHYG
jgi:predicted transcriptional regulator